MIGALLAILSDFAIPSKSKDPGVARFSLARLHMPKKELVWTSVWCCDVEFVGNPLQLKSAHPQPKSAHSQKSCAILFKRQTLL